MNKKLVTSVVMVTILVLIFVSMVSVANGVELGLIEFQTGGSGVANWTPDYKAHLYIAGDGGSYARVKVPYTIDFDDITSFSFDYYTTNAYSTPYIVIEVDKNEDGVVDDWVVQWDSRCWLGPDGEMSYESPVYGKWTTNSYDEWHDVFTLGGDPHSPDRGHRTLATEQAAIEGTVVSVKIEVGEFWDAEHDYLVTNLMINGVKLFPPPIWFKASGGGVFYTDKPISTFENHYCTIGLIGMSLEATDSIGVDGIGATIVPCKGSGTFVDHDIKIKISFNIEKGAIWRGSDNLILFWGKATVFDIDDHEKAYDVPFTLGLVDDQYGGTNRFDLICYGSRWHGTLLAGSEVTVWFWED